MRLYLFGPLRATRDDAAPLKLRADKVRALLAWLALEASAPVPRRRLTTLLWDGFRSDSASQSLRTALHDLRQATAPLEILCTTPRTVRLDGSHPDFWCDALLCDGWLAELDDALAEDAPPLSPAQRDLAAQALELCSQEFLHGLTIADSPVFGEWLAQRRAHYSRQSERLQAALRRPPVAGRATEAESLLVDWGEIPGPVALVGRERELAEVERWLVTDRARLIGIYGMGGQGKTALAAAAVRALAEKPSFSEKLGFWSIIWRSLLNAPALDEILLDWIGFLSAWQVSQLPPTLDRKIALLLELLRARPCLLVLDNLESLLEAGDRAGRFRPGYEGYGQLIQRLAHSEHPGCLLITSREQPAGMDHLLQTRPEVRSLRLSGLSGAGAVAIWRGQAVRGQESSLDALSARYSGNPLALLLAARTVNALFVGDADLFLAEDTLIFDDIRDVLESQLSRLSSLELDLLLWLTVEREAASLPSLHAALVGSRESSAVLDTLAALKRRLLVENYAGAHTGANVALFGLQNVVLEFLTDWLVTTACQELAEGRLHFLRSHALMKAQTREYVRQSQVRLILQPVVARLAARWGADALAPRLRLLLDGLRRDDPRTVGYAATNLLHLLLVSGETVADADFSHLPVRAAFLRHAHLPQANFAHADLTGSVFTDSIGLLQSVAVDPTDSYIAAGADDGRVWIWRKADQSLHQAIQTDTAFVRDISFSPDGTLLACAGTDGALSLWEVASGRLHKQLQGRGNEIKSVAFSPDGEWLASSSREGTVYLWQTATGKLRHTLSGHTGAVLQATFSRDGVLLVCSDSALQITLWDWRQATIKSRWRAAAAGHLTALVFHPNGDWVAGASLDGAIYLWEAESGLLLQRLQSGGLLYDLAFTPDGRLVVGACHDGLIYVWETTSGQRVALLSGHRHRVLSVAVCADGRTLVSGSVDQSVRVWDLPSARLLYELSGHRRSIATMALSLAGTHLAVAGNDLTVRLWDTDTWQIAASWPAHERLITTVAFRPDGQMLATGGSDRAIHLWQTSDGQRLRSLWGHSQPVERVVFHPTLPLLASGGLDNTVRLWDVATGQERALLTAHTNWVSDLAFSPDGRLLASSAADQTVRFWSLKGDHSLRSAGEFSVGEVEQRVGVILAFHPEGKLLACSTDQSVYLVEVATHQIVHTFSGHSAWITGIAFSGDGALLADVGFERSLRLWEVESGRLRWVRQSDGQVNSLRFSQDGRCLYAGRADGYIDLWDVATGNCARTVRIPGPYEGMNMRGVTGISPAQRAALLALGAVEG